jgi:hypothetical protein
MTTTEALRMARHIQSPKTGKFADSIGDGNDKVPTVSPDIALAPAYLLRDLGLLRE